MTTKQHRHYDTIARAIAYIDANQGRQPSLSEVAGHVHLSEFHFQRLFTEWAGISPKRYLQHLTLESAKQHLEVCSSLSELALDVGLSGESRLHDLFVHMEAMTPGEYKSGGHDLQIRYGTHETPFGQALLGVTDRGVCHLSFLEDGGNEALDELQSLWPLSSMVAAPQETGEILGQIFKPTTQQRRLSVLVKGTNFQIQVWRALLRLPYGVVSSYQKMAEMVMKPGAARAVGTAIGANRVAYLIPCHRVIRQNGERSRYRWGSTRKGAMLAWEASRSQ